MSFSDLPTLLCVTDNSSIRYWIKKQLENDFFILEAYTKESALLQAETTRFDFVIVDFRIVGCDPLDLCRELKNILRTLTPILLITGRLKQSFLQEAIDAGVTDFLSNQLDPDELKEKVASIRKGHSLRDKTKEISGALVQKREEVSPEFLKNRIVSEQKVLTLLKEAKDQGLPVSSLLIQMDQFEKFHGEMGDKKIEETLAALSHLIKKFISEDDVVVPETEGRFVVLLNNVTPFEGKEIAEKIRKRISEETFTATPPTVSIVVSSLSGTERDFKQVVDNSFKALKTAQDLIISIDTEPL